jgi:hypothetical protein
VARSTGSQQRLLDRPVVLLGLAVLTIIAGLATAIIADSGGYWTKLAMLTAWAVVIVPLFVYSIVRRNRDS